MRRYITLYKKNITKWQYETNLAKYGKNSSKYTNCLLTLQLKKHWVTS